MIGVDRSPRYLVRDVDRHGNARLYVRRKGIVKVRIRHEYGTPEFWAAYRDAVSVMPRAPLSPDDGHFVYIAGAPSGQLVKIGIAADPKRRLASLQTGNQGSLIIRGLYVVASRRQAAKIEQRVHSILDGRRTRGEWFRASAKEAAATIEAVAIAYGISAAKSAPPRTARTKLDVDVSHTVSHQENILDESMT